MGILVNFINTIITATQQEQADNLVMYDDGTHLLYDDGDNVIYVE